jgi:hypothetical protein
VTVESGIDGVAEVPAAARGQPVLPRVACARRRVRRAGVVPSGCSAAPTAARCWAKASADRSHVLTPIALAVVVGLWLHAAWGWWFSLIVTGYQAVSYALFLIVVLASGDATGALTWLTGLWLLAMLIVLLLPGTRRACTASS